MNLKTYSLILLSTIAFSPVRAQLSEGKVTASTLNVRVSPNTSQSVVSRVKRGDVVKIVSTKDGWIEIVAPSDSMVWIAKSAVDGGVVAQETVYRSGAGITYAPYRLKAVKGGKVEVLEDHDGWLRISPPEGLTAWISAEYVALGGEKKDDAGQKAPGKKEEAGDGSKEAIPEEKPSFTSLPPEQASYEGFLIPLAEGAVYATHAIAVKVNEAYSPICYVRSEKIKLKLWENQKIQVTGKERWIRGWKRPVMDVEMINPAGGQ